MSTEQQIQAYPLVWPVGWKRTSYRTRADFHRRVIRGDGSGYRDKQKLTIGDSRDRVLKELKMLGAKGTVISSNLRLRQDGLPISAQSEPLDPGVCVYFTLSGHKRCLPCDKWDRAADNLAAIAKFVEAMRGQQRWGVGSVEAAFAGYKALPGPDAIVTPAAMTVEQAAQAVASCVSGCVPADVIRDAENFRRAYREQAKRHHPDVSGDAVNDRWHHLQQAADVLKRHHGIG